jgi:hypothetical protein
VLITHSPVPLILSNRATPDSFFRQTTIGPLLIQADLNRVSRVGQDQKSLLIVVNRGDVEVDHFKRQIPQLDPFGALGQMDVPQVHLARPSADRQTFKTLGHTSDLMLVLL